MKSPPRGTVAALLLISSLARAGEPPSDEPDDHQRILELKAQLEAVQQRLTAQPSPSPPRPKRLDEREPPFALDFSWMNGLNPQPPSLLTLGPVTLSLYVDAYYAWQFHAPIDHTIFATSTAARHNEVSLNVGILGVDVTGLDGPIGRLYVQFGSQVETVAGQDPTTARGYFLSASAFKYLQQASVGWHFHALHGLNAEIGIFPSYVGLESYLPQENWSYTHAFISDFTPIFFVGFRGQLFPTQRLKIELWLVNGWQTFGQWHEGRAGGWFLNWRPREWVSLVHAFYIGQEVVSDPDSLRPYTDNNVQIRYYRGRGSRSRHAIQSLAVSLSADLGYEKRGAVAPNGWMGGVSLAHRFAWTDWLATTVRGDLFYDERGSIILRLPLGNPYSLPSPGPYLMGGVSLTQDVAPSPWVLFRVEYSHRESNQPYFSGRGGITGPGGIQGPFVPTFQPDLQLRDDRLIVNATLRL